MKNTITKILSIIIIIITLIFIIPKFIPNNGLEQLSIVDKMNFTYTFGLMYKKGFLDLEKMMYLV